MTTVKPTNGVHGNGVSGADLPPLASMGALPGAGLKFDHPAPEGAAKTTSQVLGEITWLMSQSAIHKQMLIADLEWPVASATNAGK